MRQASCNDVYKLAALALSAAIRSEDDDLIVLFPPEPVAKPASRRIAAPVALELVSA
jgi:hypothetical protein